MKYEIKPTKGNINLMISINEIHKILEPMVALDMNHTIITLKKIGKFTYEVPHKDFVEKKAKFAKLYECDLFGVLNASSGLYALRDKVESITDDSKFRLELKPEGEYWTQDTGEEI